MHCDLKLEHVSVKGGKRLGDNGVKHLNAHQVLDEKPYPHVLPEPSPIAACGGNEPNPVADFGKGSCADIARGNRGASMLNHRVCPDHLFLLTRVLDGHPNAL
ncbi:hypothetical protein U1Q18_036797 [Sarracenia purpurea var. burkii]